MLEFKIHKLAFIAILFFFISCDKKYKHTYISPDTDHVYINEDRYISYEYSHSELLGKKYYLCKVWGVLLHHSSVQNPNLDNDLIFFLNQIDTINIEVYREKLERLVYPYYKALTDLEEINIEYLKDNLNLSLNWLNNITFLNERTSNMLYRIIYEFNKNDKVNSLLTQSNIGLVKYKKACNQSPHGVLPSKNDRLIGLFHYWNFVEYYYPYKTLLDNNWDKVLLNTIERFEFADSLTKYKLAIIELISYLDDNHSFIHPVEITSVFGNYVPNFRILKIDNNFVVNKIRSKKIDNGNIKRGDIVLSIDSIVLSKLYGSLSAYVAGSNSLSKNRELNKLMLCKKDKLHTIRIKRGDSIFDQKVEFFDYLTLNEFVRKEKYFWKNFNVSKELVEGIGYLSINHLFEDNIQRSLRMMHKFEKGVILDMRHYPNKNTSSELINFVLSKDTLTYCFFYPDLSRPGLFRFQKRNSLFKIHGKKSYRKKIILLVDENTQSHAEFLVMAMQTNPNVLVVGNVSAGADGNITSFTFPSDIEVKMSGIGILYPDFLETQRIGVKIDHQVNHELSDIVNKFDPWIKTSRDILSGN
ncbi:MAG: hypothetical protein GY756_25865 [bacterium]|nr:hypothetical protein [bacterium]